MNKKHYFLIAGQVIYQPLNTKDQPENPLGVMTLNTLVTTDEMLFRVRDIAKAQQGLQKQFYETVQDNTIKIVNVILVNVSYLGLMEQEDFMAVPEGTKEQSK